MLTYPVTLEPDDNDMILVTLGAFPGATFGADETEALAQAKDAIEVAIAGLMSLGKDIPLPPREFRRAPRGSPSAARSRPRSRSDLRRHARGRRPQGRVRPALGHRSPRDRPVARLRPRHAPQSYRRRPHRASCLTLVIQPPPQRQGRPRCCPALRAKFEALAGERRGGERRRREWRAGAGRPAPRRSQRRCTEARRARAHRGAGPRP